MKKSNLMFLGAFALGLIQVAQAKDAESSGVVNHSSIAQMHSDFKQALKANGSTIEAFVKKYPFSCDSMAERPQVSMLTCHIYDEADQSPSPWPILTIGIEQKRMVAFSSAQKVVSKNWRCDSLTQEAPICLLRQADAKVQQKWAQHWTTLFRSAN